jgi:hypothetical protein
MDMWVTGSTVKSSSTPICYTFIRHAYNFHTDTLLRLPDSEDESTRVFQRVSNHLLGDTVQQPTRPESSTIPLQESQNSHLWKRLLLCYPYRQRVQGFLSCGM